MRHTRHALACAALCGSALLLTGCASGPTAIDARTFDASASTAQAGTRDGAIAPYHARPGHARPLIAVVGDNASTELSDYVVPYGILARSGVADVMALATAEGPISTTTDMGKPGFRIEPEATIARFDARFPDGADYVIVPATRNTPALHDWIAQQVAKGATIVSICNGAQIVARSGMMDGHLATAHWASEQERMERQPAIRWVKNARYVADRNWVSSAGVSAAMPTSIALVEAIAGRAHASALADELAIADWSARHDSDAFQPRFGHNLTALATTVYTNAWFHHDDALGIPAAPGVDEVALALTVDAYSSTGRSHAWLVADSVAPLRTRHGLRVIPDRSTGEMAGLDHVLAAPDATAPGKAVDRALAGIASLYGRTNAYGVALLLEYPDFHD
ncbi:DJ-1/PfpI family protein [Rugamonas apoptosis]|uniref:DJ-1/PfpI family protein n=1 Tax=Rugamonas apoptosis TaxID=2758570 RepID=UPI001C70D22B|nr:DJ-1/PfpI family protein [Rugamonas apoptosis]